MISLSPKANAGLLRTPEGEVRVLDDAEHVPEGVGDMGDADTAAHLLDAATFGRPEFEEARVSVVRVLHAPVGDDALAAYRTGIAGLPGLQPELEATDVEAGVERLVELGFLAKHNAVPLLRPVQVPNSVDRRPQAQDHLCPFASPPFAGLYGAIPRLQRGD